MEELFKSKIDGYSVTKSGQVYSHKSNRFLKGYIDSNGYPKVTIKAKHVPIHRIVLESFIDKPSDLHEVDHIDRNPENNNLSNLRWVTKSENVRNSNLYRNGKRKLTDQQIDEIVSSNKSQVQLAKQYNVSTRTIRRFKY